MKSKEPVQNKTKAAAPRGWVVDLLSSLPKDGVAGKSLNSFRWFLDKVKEGKYIACKQIAVWESNLALDVSALTMVGSWEGIMQKHCVCLPFSLSQYGCS